MNTVDIQTNQKFQLIDITDKIIPFVEGDFLHISVPHTTCGIIINEKEFELHQDFDDFFLKVTSGINYQHMEGNGRAHILSSMFGHQKIIPIERGKLVLGTWQHIFLAEFDGPRTRRVNIKTW